MKKFTILLTLLCTSTTLICMELGMHPYYPYNHRTPLGDAAEKGNLEKVRELLKQDVDVNECDRYGCTALHHAASGGYDLNTKESRERCRKKIAIINMLLNHRAEASAQNRWGDTPLHEACLSAFAPAIKTLLDRGAQNRIENSSRTTPFGMLSINSDDKTWRLISDIFDDHFVHFMNKHLSRYVRSRNQQEVEQDNGLVQLFEKPQATTQQQ